MKDRKSNRMARDREQSSKRRVKQVVPAKTYRNS